MAEENESRLPKAESGEQEKREHERDLADGLALMADLRAMMRRGGLILGGLIALLGWYFSREWGEWFLIGGVALGALVGGGMAFSGALTGLLAKKYLTDSRNKGEKPGK